MRRRVCAALAVSLTTWIVLTADEPSKKSTTPKPVWTLDAAKMKIPEAKASGTIHGVDFTVEKAELENGVLTLRQGKDFFPDLALDIFLFLKDGENIDGKNYKITTKSGFDSPHVHMKWKTKDQQIPEAETYTKDYAMLLQFGKGKDGVVPGKIYVCLPDKSKSCVAGTFVIGDAGGEGAGGDISGKIVFRGSPKGIWLDVGCLGKGPNGQFECPGVGFKLGEGTSSATCTTWKPRNTTLAWKDKASGTHRHTARPPGQYLVFLRGRPDGADLTADSEGFYDWKWVELKDADSKVTVDLTIDLTKLGNVEVSVPGAADDSMVSYYPLDTNGKLPLPDVHSSLQAFAKVRGGKAMIHLLREGKYQMACNGAKADVEVKAGMTVKTELKLKK
jgi:hypothetical protein